MPATTLPLSLLDLFVAGGLVLVAGMVSLALGLDMERRLAWAAARTVVQLLLLGAVLGWVFHLESGVSVLLLMLGMIALAAREAVRRSAHRYPRVRSDAFVSLVIAGLLTTGIVTQAIIHVDPWYRPQYVIPLLGMILGNGLTGLSICVDALLTSFADKSAQIECELALGASRWEAARGPIADAVRRGMIPIINAMMVVGLVSLPGMMTGQIIAGADPGQAVRYQIVVMFMIASAVSMSCILMALLTYRRLFNERHQLRSELLERVAG